MEVRSDLDRELDKGELRELPSNIAPGFLGEVAPDLRKTDEFEPSLNSGISQDETWETRWLTIVLLHLLVITSPVALWLLWRDPRRTVRVKIMATVLGIGVYAVVWILTSR